MRRLEPGDARLCLESAVLLAFTRIALAACEFATILRWLATVTAGAAGTVRRRPPLAARQITRAVTRAARFVPGGKHCLTQALVTKYLLARDGIATQLRLGVASDAATRLTAHAWLEQDGVAVFGIAPSDRSRYAMLPDIERL